MSLGSGHSSARCPRESFCTVYRLALSPVSAPEGNARWKWSWQLHLPPPYPGSSARQGPGLVLTRPGLPSRLSTLPPARREGTGASSTRRAQAGPRDRAGASKGISPHHFSPGAWAGARPAAPEALGRQGSGEGDGRHPHIPP